MAHMDAGHFFIERVGGAFRTLRRLSGEPFGLSWGLGFGV